MTPAWATVVDALNTEYAKKMFFGQDFSNDLFLESLLPEGEFFGVKSLNIFIVSKPYGWKQDPTTGKYNFSWPPDGVTDALARTTNNFVSYQTLVWVDKYTANELKRDHPESDIDRMMDETASSIESMCLGTTNFIYMGKIETAPTVDIFKSAIDAFYGNPKYLK